MTIKDWNNLDVPKRSYLVNTFAVACGYEGDVNFKASLNKKFISSTAKLTPHQKELLKAVKILPNGKIRMTLEIEL